MFFFFFFFFFRLGEAFKLKRSLGTALAPTSARNGGFHVRAGSKKRWSKSDPDRVGMLRGIGGGRGGWLGSGWPMEKVPCSNKYSGNGNGNLSKLFRTESLEKQKQQLWRRNHSGSPSDSNL